MGLRLLAALALLLGFWAPPGTSLGSNLYGLHVNGATQRAGAEETWTVEFKVPISGDLSGFQIVTDFPAGFSVQPGRVCDVDGATGETISVNGLEVTCTIGSGSFPDGATLLTHITHMKNPTVAQTTEQFHVEFNNNVGVHVASGTAPSVAIHNNLFQSLSASAADPRAGEVTDWTVHFTTKNPVAANGDVHLIFPPGFDVASDAACSIAGLSGPALSWASATDVACNLNSASLGEGASYDLTITNVMNPGHSQSPLLRVATRNANHKLHDESNATLQVDPHPFQSASFASDSNTAGSMATYTFTFRLFNTWPADGCLRVSFAPGVGLTADQTRFSLAGGTDGLLGATTLDGQKARACRSGGSPTAAGSTISATLSNVQLPLDSQDPVQVVLDTLNAALDGIDKADGLLQELVPECVSDCNTPPPPPPGAPAEPRSLAAAPGASAGSIALSWLPPATEGASPVSGFKVYRAQTNSGPYVLIKIVDQVQTYLDAGLGNGAKRFYRVAAINANGEGNLSNVATATTPGSPAMFTPHPSGTGSTRVDPLADDGDGYEPGPLAPWKLLENARHTPTFMWGLAAALVGLGWGGAGGYLYWRRRHMRRKP